MLIFSVVHKSLNVEATAMHYPTTKNGGENILPAPEEAHDGSPSDSNGVKNPHDDFLELVIRRMLEFPHWLSTIYRSSKILEDKVVSKQFLDGFNDRHSLVARFQPESPEARI